METDVISQMVAMAASRTQGLAQIAVMRQQHKMDMELVAMLTEATRAAPPPGQGRVVDKLA
jgi:hypothetical protein